MLILRELRRRAPIIVAPIFGIALTTYFAYHLVEGDRGLRAWLRLTQDLRGEKANLEAAEVAGTRYHAPGWQHPAEDSFDLS